MKLHHWLLSLLLLLCSSANADPTLPNVRVQLSWFDQSQYAGFYVAQKKGYFNSAGLQAVIVPGGPEIDPITALTDGTADVAVADLFHAWRFDDPNNPVVNIAQIFDGSALRLMCRTSDGITRLEDVVGKTIGVASWGDSESVRAMLRSVAPDDSRTRYVQRGATGRELVDRQVSCITGMTYNEYFRVIEAGILEYDLTVFSPGDYGANDTEDGLYVLAKRLEDPQFRDNMAKLVRGLQRGWEDARQRPAAAVSLVMVVNPTLDRAQQMLMLETVLELLPPKDIGFFKLDYLENLDGTQTLRNPRERLKTVWTHKVWNRMNELEGKTATFTPATLHYAQAAEKSVAFSRVLLFGICFFALSGALVAVHQGYDIWGRLVVAMTAALGGGMLRDLVIHGPRIPFAFLNDPTFPLAILIVVVLLSLFLLWRPLFEEARTWQSIQRVSEAIGFGILTVFGSLVAINAGLSWYWAPVCAALTCAGGGILRDILVNREPSNFRGAIYEELAVAGALLLVAGLMLANQFEQSPIVAYWVIGATGMLTGMTRFCVDHYGLRYPAWLLQGHDRRA